MLLDNPAACTQGERLGISFLGGATSPIRRRRRKSAARELQDDGTGLLPRLNVEHGASLRMEPAAGLSGKMHANLQELV